MDKGNIHSPLSSLIRILQIFNQPCLCQSANCQIQDTILFYVGLLMERGNVTYGYKNYKIVSAIFGQNL